LEDNFRKTVFENLLGRTTSVGGEQQLFLASFLALFLATSGRVWGWKLKLHVLEESILEGFGLVLAFRVVLL
jgi:hypothetical protein